MLGMINKIVDVQVICRSFVAPNYKTTIGCLEIFNSDLPRTSSTSDVMLVDSDISIIKASASDYTRPAVTFASLDDLLEQYPSSAEEVEWMVSALVARYPNYPRPQINYPD